MGRQEGAEGMGNISKNYANRTDIHQSVGYVIQGGGPGGDTTNVRRTYGHTKKNVTQCI